MQEKIRPGYKQTEVGLIPEDWDVSLVDDLVASGVIEKPMDGNHGAIHPKSSDFVDFGVPFIMANHVYQGTLDLDTCPHISRKQADSLQKGFARTGDILLTHKATIGEIAIVGEIPFDYIMLTPQVTFYRVKKPEKIGRDYLFHYFNGSTFQEHLKLLSGGGTRSYIGITAQRMLRIVLPRRIGEQNAIAEALSDADARIAALEALIAKKRDFKQAAVQQLLTGKTRLPGFSGEWAVKRLGEIAHLTKGSQLHRGKLKDGGRYPHYNGGVSPSGFADVTNTPAETVAISEGGNSCGFVHFINQPFWCGGHCYALNPIGIKKRFLYHSLKARQADIMALRVGSGLPNVQKGTLSAFQLHMPTSVQEQTAIAEVLSDMDAELAALDAEAEKARAIKQGMMQNLLTGKVRLV